MLKRTTDTLTVQQLTDISVARISIGLALQLAALPVRPKRRRY
jgi:hypothetical protein